MNPTNYNKHITTLHSTAFSVRHTASVLFARPVLGNAKFCTLPYQSLRYYLHKAASVLPSSVPVLGNTKLCTQTYQSLRYYLHKAVSALPVLENAKLCVRTCQSLRYYYLLNGAPVSSSVRVPGAAQRCTPSKQSLQVNVCMHGAYVRFSIICNTRTRKLMLKLCKQTQHFKYSRTSKPSSSHRINRFCRQ